MELSNVSRVYACLNVLLIVVFVLFAWFLANKTLFMTQSRIGSQTSHWACHDTWNPKNLSMFKSA